MQRVSVQARRIRPSQLPCDQRVGMAPLFNIPGSRAHGTSGFPCGGGKDIGGISRHVFHLKSWIGAVCFFSLGDPSLPNYVQSTVVALVSHARVRKRTYGTTGGLPTDLFACLEI